MVLIVDVILAIWIAFNASLHIGKFPYLKIFYYAIIPLAFVFPIVDAIVIKKAKKNLLLINDIYLCVRIVYLAFFFINEIRYRLTESAVQIDKAISNSIVWSGIFEIAFVVVFSAFWISILHLSKAIKYHIDNK